jgi:hypothetical protein
LEAIASGNADRRRREARLDLTPLEHGLGEDICAPVRVEERCARVEGIFGADDRRELVDLERDEVDSVFSDIPAVGDDDRDRMAGVVDAVGREHGVRHVSLPWLQGVHPQLGHAEAGEVAGQEHAVDAL